MIVWTKAVSSLQKNDVTNKMLGLPAHVWIGSVGAKSHDHYIIISGSCYGLNVSTKARVEIQLPLRGIKKMET
jgi:hypothetical protein